MVKGHTFRIYPLVLGRLVLWEEVVDNLGLRPIQKGAWGSEFFVRWAPRVVIQLRPELLPCVPFAFVDYSPQLPLLCLMFIV